MSLKRIILYLPLLLWSVTAFGQTASTALSMQEAIDFAQQNNSNIKISRYDEEISRQQTNEVKGRGLPQFNINGSFEDRLKLPQLVLPEGFGGAAGAEGGAIPLGYKFNSSLSGEVTQMIYDQSFWLGLKAAKFRSQLAQQGTRQVTENTAYNVASAYYQAIVVQKQLQLLRSNLANTRKTLANSELQLSNGVARRVDVNRLRVNASNLESQIRQAELNLAQSLNALKFQMGMPQEQPVMLRDTVLTFRQDEAVLANALNNNVYENRIEYQLLQTNLELQDLDIRNTRSGFFPTLRGFGNYGYQGQGADFGLFGTANNGWVDYTTSSIGVRLSIPLFDGLQRNSRVAQSRLKVKQLEENINLTKQNINLDIANALTQYRNTLQRIQAEGQNVDLAEEVYGVTQLELREGVGTSNNVVEAETALRQAQNTYITTLLNLYTARLDLERAKGTLLPYLNSK